MLAEHEELVAHHAAGAVVGFAGVVREQGRGRTGTRVVFTAQTAAQQTADPRAKVRAARRHVASGLPLTDFPDAERIPEDQLLTLQCTVLVPAALERGDLHWSGVRELTRVATAATEAELVEDFALLKRWLAERGLQYEVVVQSINFDAELPSAFGFDVRHTDREVILARSDLKTADLKLSNAQGGNFAVNCQLQTPALGTLLLVADGKGGSECGMSSGRAPGSIGRGHMDRGQK